MSNNLIFFFLLIFHINCQFFDTVQKRVARYAKENEGSDAWSYGNGNYYMKLLFNGKDRMAENGKTFFCDYEPKCNLFVYEMLYKAGLELPLINSMSRKCKEFHEDKPQKRPPTNSDIVNGKVNLLSQSWEPNEGDIITNGHHMGIILGKDLTISASEKSIRTSDFDAYRDKGETFYIFKYDKGYPIFTYSIKTKNKGIQSEIRSSSWGETGIKGDPIIGIAIKVDRCQVNYRVHIKNGDWLPMVKNKYDWNDINGYAGNDKEIDLVEVNFIYCNHNPKINEGKGYWNVPYRVSPLYKNFYDWQYGNEKDKGRGLDGYAGAKGVSIDHFQIGYD